MRHRSTSVQPRIGHVLALTAALLLAGCYQLPDSATALTARDRLEVQRMHGIWLDQGLPDPAERCDLDDLYVAHPATPAEVLDHCHRCSCDDASCPSDLRERYGCADECLVAIAEGFGPFTWDQDVAIVSQRIQRRAWRHEFGHYAEQCAGLPRSHTDRSRPEDNERFERWLRAVERDSYPFPISTPPRIQ